MIKVLSLFSGIGAFEKALKRRNIPFELLGFSGNSYLCVNNSCQTGYLCMLESEVKQ